jgi:hypothetical protein
MTDQEMAEIGRLITELKNSKTRLSALESGFQEICNRLKTSGSILLQAVRSPSENALSCSSLDAAIQEIPTQDHLNQLLSDLRSERETFRSLSKKSSNLGLPS